MASSSGAGRRRLLGAGLLGGRASRAALFPRRLAALARGLRAVDLSEVPAETAQNIQNLQKSYDQLNSSLGCG